MRKVILAAVLVCLCLSCAAYGASRFRDFPAKGICTGDYVRLREEPNTSSMVMGRLFKGDTVIVVSQSTVKGEVWYEIEDPEDEYGETTVWVYGKYIRPRR